MCVCGSKTEIKKKNKKLKPTRRIEKLKKQCVRDVKIVIFLLHPAEGVNLAGTYACEVSTESPNFLTKYQSANMSVAVVPTRDPAMDGVRASYTVDEIMEAECTSAPSYPAANLTFILNDREVNCYFILQKQFVAGLIGHVFSTSLTDMSESIEA